MILQRYCTNCQHRLSPHRYKEKCPQEYNKYLQISVNTYEVKTGETGSLPQELAMQPLKAS